MKFTYDVLGEECLNRLDAISPPSTGELPRNRSRLPTKENTEPPPKRDLYALLRDNAASDEKLGELWTEVNTIPEWVNWDQIARGQDVFYRYGGVALTGVCFIPHSPFSVLHFCSWRINHFLAAWEQQE